VSGGSLQIGLCYDLRDDYLARGFAEEATAEFDMPGTIDAIERALRELGHRTARIGSVHELAARLVEGARYDLVFNTAEGVAGFGREAQVPALLEAWDIAYTFSDPLTAALTLHKALAKRVLRDAAVPTAPFALVADEGDLAAVDLGWPLFVKPVAEGTAKGIDATSRVDDSAALRRRALHVIETWGQPALVEPFLPGREFTVGVLGTGKEAHAIGTLEVVIGARAEAHAYTYLNKERCEELCEFPLADPASAALVEPIALAAWRALGARDAGRVDLRLDAAGRPFVLELNPLPGMHPTHSDLPMLCTATGMPYVDLVGAIVRSARTRISPPAPSRAARLA
jgi:D-alanine-D-alanine ligase